MVWFKSKRCFSRSSRGRLTVPFLPRKSPMAQTYKRRKKLVNPGLQLRMSGVFVGLTALMLGLQFVLMTAELHQVANKLPSDGSALLEESNGIVLKLILVSAAVFLPLTLLVGILSTFRIAGPLYRFQRFLEAVRDGESPADFRLRDKDELHDLAALLNDATRPMRLKVVLQDLPDAPKSDADDTSDSGEAKATAAA